MQENEKKDELSKEDKEENLLIKKSNEEARKIAKIGFIIAVSSTAFILFLSFLLSCLVAIKSGSLNAGFSKAYNVLYRIGQIVCIAGLIVSIIGYVKAAKDDTKSKIFSAIGMTLGAMQAWAFVSNNFVEFIRMLFA